MIKLDDNLLQEIGLAALSADDKKKMLAHIYETLEMRVGMELAKQMSDAQLSEFEEFINRNDEAGALRWLESNFPNYKDVVAAEFDKLKAEIRQVAPQILASSQAQPPMPSVPQPPMQPMPQQPQPQYAAPAYQPQQPMAPQQPQYAYPTYAQQQPMQQAPQASYQQPMQQPQAYAPQYPAQQQPPIQPQPPMQGGQQPQGDQNDYDLAR